MSLPCPHLQRDTVYQNTYGLTARVSILFLGSFTTMPMEHTVLNIIHGAVIEVYDLVLFRVFVDPVQTYNNFLFVR